MSKLDLSTGENRCVIQFKAGAYPSTTYDSGTFETPVWWCTKDSSNYFNVPEQFYLVYAWQNTSSVYIDPNSSLSLYNSQFSGGVTFYTLTHASSSSHYPNQCAVWITMIKKFKVNLILQSGGVTIDYYVAVIPL